MKNPFGPPTIGGNIGKDKDAKGKDGKDADKKPASGKTGKSAYSSSEAISTIKDDYIKRVQALSGKPAAEQAAPAKEMTGSNYMQLYQDKLEAEEAAKQEKKRIDKEKYQAKKREEQAKADALITRARDLQSQIAGLKQRLGQDAETDRRTQGAIDQLKNELGGIPVIYWR
jgi:hypothetical protein